MHWVSVHMWRMLGSAAGFDSTSVLVLGFHQRWDTDDTTSIGSVGDTQPKSSQLLCCAVICRCAALWSGGVVDPMGGAAMQRERAWKALAALPACLMGCVLGQGPSGFRI